jgi:gamma-glutamyl-gamma-aminobutyrate hydrolase PuuD
MAVRVALTYRREDKLGTYRDALRATGIEPVCIKPGGTIPSLREFGGLLLSGGTDLNASLYGAAPGPHDQEPDDERDTLELTLLREALEADLPVLAICRGLQLCNVAHGGTLIQQVEGHKLDAGHDVVVAEGTVLARILGPGVHSVNSRHHQAAAAIGDGLIVSARARHDSSVEALERSDRRFAVAVQWHPEDQFASQRKLFEAFAQAL